MISPSIVAAVAMLHQAREMRDRGLPESSLRHLLSSYLRGIFPGEETRVNRFVADIEASVSTRVSSIASRQGFVDVLAGATAMEFEPDLRSRSHLDEARQQALQYAAAIAQQGIPVGQIRAVVTDVVDWFVYDVRLRDGHGRSGQTAPMQDDLELVVPEVEVAHLSAATVEDAEQLVRIFRRHVFRERSRALTAANIAMDLGPQSPIAREAASELESVVVHARTVDTSVALACDLWSQFVDGLESRSGHAFRGGVYAQEAYLSLLARLLSACVLGRTSDLPEDVLAGVLTGDYFDQRFHLNNVVTKDYFHWLCLGGYLAETMPVMSELQRALLAYDFSRAPDPDFVGDLLAELALIPNRKLLGQHATPQWLARRMAISALADLGDNQSARFIDMCCGTGQIIAQFLIVLQELKPSMAAADLASSIVGIDIDPMAVALAKTTWIAVLAERLRTDMDVTSVPIYNADSLALSSTWTARTPQQDSMSPAAFDMDGSLVDIPPFLLSPARLQLFDAIVARSYQWAVSNAGGSSLDSNAELEATVTRAVELEHPRLTSDERRAVLLTSLRLASSLTQKIRERRDGIWAFMLRDSSRPELLVHQFGGLITNPPWLAMSSLARNPYSDGLRNRARRYSLVPRSEAAPHLELATTYLIDAVDRYLRVGASVTCLLPGTVKAGAQHQPFRDGGFLQAQSPVRLLIDAIWDVPVGTFNVEAVVLRGHKSDESSSVQGDIAGGTVNEHGVTYHSLSLSELGTGRTSWTTVDPQTGSRASRGHHANAKEGADLMPRKAVFVTITDHTATRVYARTPQITEDFYYATADARSGESIAVDGWVQQKYVHHGLISKDLVPYVVSHAQATIVVPVVGNSHTGWHIQPLDVILRDDSASGAYFVSVNRQLEALSGDRDDSIQTRLDARRKLTSQHFRDGAWVVLMGAGGSNICAAAVPSSELTDTLVDQTLYWLAVDSQTEAYYFVGMLNSAVVQHRVSGFQPTGQFGPRHVHSVPFDVVPAFDSRDALHLDVARAVPGVLKAVQSYLTADLRLTDSNAGLAWRRRQIRAMLATEPQAVTLEQSVHRVLGG